MYINLVCKRIMHSFSALQYTMCQHIFENESEIKISDPESSYEIMILTPFKVGIIFLVALSMGCTCQFWSRDHLSSFFLCLLRTNFDFVHQWHHSFEISADVPYLVASSVKGKICVALLYFDGLQRTEICK